MTTGSSQMTTYGPNDDLISELGARDDEWRELYNAEKDNCAAAVAETAAAIDALRRVMAFYNAGVSWMQGEGAIEGDELNAAIDAGGNAQAILANLSPAVAALGQRLAQAEDELDAIDESLDEFYCPDANDHGVSTMRWELKRWHTALLRRMALDNSAPSSSSAVLKWRLAPMPCGHPGACVVSGDEGTNHCAWCEEVAVLWDAGKRLGAEMDAVDEALGKFYMPVLDDDDEPCGAFFKDHGVNVMAQALEEAEERAGRAEALAALVPEAQLLNYLGGCAFLVAAMKELHDEPYEEVEKFGKEARALAARIADVRSGHEEAQQRGQGEDSDITI